MTTEAVTENIKDDAMDAGLQRMEMELRLLRKKYFFLQETIENKVDVRVKNTLAQLEDGIIERVIEKVLARIDTGVAVIQPCYEVGNDIGIQLQNAGEVNGEMIAANVKQEPIDYDDTIPNEDIFEYNFNPDDHLNTTPTDCEGNLESSLVVENYEGSHLISEAQQERLDDTNGEMIPSPPPDTMYYSSDANEDVADIEVRQEEASITINSLRGRTPPEPPILTKEYENTKGKTVSSSKKGEKKHGCKECDMKFASASYLRRHMVKHISAKPFRCSLCTKSYKRLPHLRRHIKDSHPNSTMQVPFVRNKKDSKQPQLKVEAKSPSRGEIKMKSPARAEAPLEVTGTKNNYDCSICGKHFSYPSHLKPHLLGHARKLAKQGLAV